MIYEHYLEIVSKSSSKLLTNSFMGTKITGLLSMCENVLCSINNSVGCVLLIDAMFSL